ncbi:hypothetical protein LTR56_023468 [Elasticomyces elasticus]|nr:hypothetical protein LTR56_023468 [Elasticomyces elasticus]KAK3625509.1 hypothetical protein LTR22_023523 [Elasticomyces elasticus]KAK4920670.1 hypothetical protein LTR49_011746 [Elasticomyces elasticus]KAK5746320.1 hypothetical protein LTS12_022753 [Elasticomyces elasticus]
MSSIRPLTGSPCLSTTRTYLAAGFPSLSISAQQVRGKKKLANTSSAVPVRLLKNVETFGRKGSIVPISPGLMRNNWFPRRVAEYMTLPEQRSLRQKGLPIERDFDYDPSFKATPTLSTSAGDSTGSMSRLDKQDASMFQRASLDPTRLTPERCVELLEIFVPSRGLEFYRQPIIEEAPLPPAPMEAKKPAKSFGFGAGAELMAARAHAAEEAKKPKPKVQGESGQAIYGSVSTHDVLMAVRAAMAENDEARMVVIREDDVKFVDAEETDRVKMVGTFVVEIKVKNVEEGVKRNVKVIAQEIV